MQKIGSFGRVYILEIYAKYALAWGPWLCCRMTSRGFWQSFSTVTVLRGRRMVAGDTVTGTVGEGCTGDWSDTMT